MTGRPNKHLIVIAGPTAVGKTSFAIEVAAFFNTEIISCDSRQVYQELNIGVAKPSPQELQQIKHYCIGTHSITEDYNAGIFAEEANSILNKLFKEHSVVIMAGGTGLYIKAATKGLDKLPTKNEALRAEFAQASLEQIQEKAKTIGIVPEEVEWQNPQRLLRAIEIKLGEKQVEEQPHKDYQTHYYFLNRDRQELYQRINQRVDIMMEEGLEEEVRSLIPYQHLNALQTVGYKEFFNYFNGDWTKEFAIEKIKQHTRNYAKRQLTWFRNQDDYVEIATALEPFLSEVENYVS